MHRSSFRRLLSPFALALFACGSGHSPVPGSNAPAGAGGSDSAGLGGADGSGQLDAAGGSTAPTSCEPALDCATTGSGCGLFEDSQCGHVDCGTCRWGATDLGALPTIGADPSGLHVAFIETVDAMPGIAYARLASDGSLTGKETVAPLASSVLERAPALAIGADGVVHVVWAVSSNDSSQVWHAERTAEDGWNVESVAAGRWADLALDGAGQPQIIYQRDEASGSLLVSSRDSAGWHEVELEHAGAGWPSIALDAAGVPHAAYVARPTGGASLIRLAGSDGAGRWTVEDVQSSVEVFAGVTLALAYGADGEPRIAVATQRPGACLLTRSAGVFSVMTLHDGLSRGDIALALGAADQPHVGYFTDDGLMYATLTRDGTVSQRQVSARCDTGQASLALDALGSPHIVHSCASFDGQHEEVIGTYPASYHASCDAVVAQLCPLACDCDPTSECSYDGQSNGAHFGPASICPSWVRDDFCSSDTIDPTLLTTCESALAAGEGACESGSYRLPAECDPVLRGNQ